ncbi:Haloacid dehalogenase-like hydrolase domain-containing protein [Camellia lanceoleosa]|uniref:Haloacid dehalogenase-like hydrolase domain-containing protein n=1 Tax=Camellia lanceoleosa TaxID=1840588 RepID=A0ACC0GW86_9ERIC|nr:Haloacid dehalogenase-like hydrolase domain-containing protein [Camellia lanceoleosa]
MDSLELAQGVWSTASAFFTIEKAKFVADSMATYAFHNTSIRTCFGSFPPFLEPLLLCDALGTSQFRCDWKTERYKEIIRSGTVEPRPGVLRLMDEAKDADKKLAVCSVATESSVVLCFQNLIGIECFKNLDCFLGS